MALIEHLPASEVATAAARALERVLGHDVMLTVGEPIPAPPDFDLFNASFRTV